MRDTQRAFKRDARKLQMITAMLIRVEKGAQPHTAYSLATALDMRVSPHFRKILEELVSAGLVHKVEKAHRPNRVKYWYEPDTGMIKKFYGNVWREHRQRKKKRDRIVINVGGEQLSMCANWRK